MKAREFAISKGLAKPGRGKLSAAAHAAIKEAIADGQTFEDYGSNRVSNSVRPVTVQRNSKLGTNRQSNRTEGQVEDHRSVPFALPAQVVRRSQTTIYGIDRMGNKNVLIAFDHCAKCMNAVIYCVHDTPQLPEWVGGGDALMEKTNV